MKNCLHENNSVGTTGKSISVIIASRNRYEKLKKCVSSLLPQAMPSDEIIIVDDFSDDFTPNIAMEYPIKYIRTPEKVGASIARNIGIRVATGELVAFIDDDAIAHSRWLEELIKSYSEGDVDGVRGKVIPLNPQRVFHDPVFIAHYDLGDKKKVVGEEFGLSCNMSLKRSVFAEVGIFNKELPYYREDYELALRLLKAGKRLTYNPHVIVYHDYAKNLYNLFKKRFILGFRLAYVIFKHRLKISLRRIPYIMFLPSLIALLMFIIYAFDKGVLFATILLSLFFARFYVMTKRARRIDAAIIASLADFIRDLGLLMGIVWSVVRRVTA